MKPLRSDAAARRELILEAAYAVFAEHGVTVPLDMVITRAGVGRATLYRNFPDRTALIQALLERSVVELEQLAIEHQDNDDALFVLFTRMAANVVRAAPLADYWRAMVQDDPFVIEMTNRFNQLFEKPIARAIHQGLCRKDLQISDISLIVGMLGAALRGRSPEERQELSERALQLVQTGLCARAEQAERPGLSLAA